MKNTIKKACGFVCAMATVFTLYVLISLVIYR